MKLLFRRHKPSPPHEAIESAQRAKEQLAAAERNRRRVYEDSSWAKRTRELDPLTASFIKSLGGQA